MWTRLSHEKLNSTGEKHRAVRYTLQNSNLSRSAAPISANNDAEQTVPKSHRFIDVARVLMPGLQ